MCVFIKKNGKRSNKYIQFTGIENSCLLFEHTKNNNIYIFFMYI